MIKVLVPTSGGKDSQACMKLALEHYDKRDIRGLFCDTQFEHPKTYQHVRETMGDLYGVEIVTVTGGSVLGKSLKYGRFPGGGARHCTDELKIRETKIYLKALAEKQGGLEVWYGMRLKESHERSKRYAGKVSTDLYAPHEVIPNKYPKYLAKMGVQFRLAVLEWSEQDVIDYIGWDNLNPLYHDDFPRVGCFPCLASGDQFKEKAFQYDDFGKSQYEKVIDVSRIIGKSIWTSKGGKERNEPPCALCNE
jgi:3'-phosphoadenosine 5'-phosphosulfate sulfotransferase (PAPS reductase)/FAD synthetase